MQYYCADHIAIEGHDCPRAPIKNPYEMTNQPASTNYVTPSNVEVAPTPMEHPTLGDNDYDDKHVYTDGSYVWYRKEKSEVPDDAFNPESGVVIPGLLWPKLSELAHFLIASALIVGLAATGFISVFSEFENPLIYIVFLSTTYWMAFILHEFGHRQTAKHFGLQTKFRLFKWGVVLSVICLFLPVKFSLPGAVVVIGLENISRETGLCKLAGPLTNLVQGSIFLLFAFLPFVTFPWNWLCLYSAIFNFMLGSFNMLPFGILDGDNIRKWKPKVWILMFIALLSLLIMSFIISSNETIMLAFQLRGT